MRRLANEPHRSAVETSMTLRGHANDAVALTVTSNVKVSNYVLALKPISRSDKVAEVENDEKKWLCQ
jgi:hypothetical protein